MLCINCGNCNYLISMLSYRLSVCYIYYTCYVYYAPLITLHAILAMFLVHCLVKCEKTHFKGENETYQDYLRIISTLCRSIYIRPSTHIVTLVVDVYICQLVTELFYNVVIRFYILSLLLSYNVLSYYTVFYTLHPIFIVPFV